MNSMDEAKAAVERFNDACNHGDVGVVMAMTTPDVVFANTSGERVEGQRAVRASWIAPSGLSAGWFDTEEVVALDDRVVLRTCVFDDWSGSRSLLGRLPSS